MVDRQQPIDNPPDKGGITVNRKNLNLKNNLNHLAQLVKILVFAAIVLNSGIVSVDFSSGAEVELVPLWRFNTSIDHFVIDY